MSSTPTPTYNFPGIDYNPKYYNTVASSSGLSIATANNLYLRKTVSDTATSLETFSGGIKTNNLDPLTTSGTLTVTGQTEFTVAPNCSDTPVASNDLCNKNYVDGKISAGGSTFFYLNNSVSNNLLIPGTQQLSNVMAITATQQVLTYNKPATSILVASFATDSGIPSTTLIPSGVWVLNQWAMSDANTTGSLKYQFDVCRYRPSTAVTTVLGTSTTSADVKAVGTPELYFASLTMAAQTVTIEDIILIKIYAIGVGVSGSFSSYYQKDYFSYITAPVQINTFSTYGGSISTTILGSSPFALPRSFQLPIGTYLFIINVQFRFTAGSFVEGYAVAYSGATSGALTTSLIGTTNANLGMTTIVSNVGTKFVGINGTQLMVVSTPNLWYTYGFTWVGPVTCTEIVGGFNAVKFA